MTVTSPQTGLNPEALDRLRPHHDTIINALRELKPLNELATTIGCSSDEITAYVNNVHSVGSMNLSREKLNAVELARLSLSHDRIAEGLKAGRTYRDIAKEVDTSPAMLSRYVLKTDLPARTAGFPRGRSRSTNDPVRLERQQRAVELRRQGMTLKEIAHAMGYTSKERARQLLKEAGHVGSREEIAADRILIVEAIVPYLAQGMSIEKISELLQDKDIKTLEIVDTINAARKNYYERQATMPNPWPILPKVLEAMKALRAALSKRSNVKQEKAQALSRRSTLMASALRALTPDQRMELAATVELHKVTINTLAAGSRVPTAAEWKLLAPHLPSLKAVEMPE